MLYSCDILHLWTISNVVYEDFSLSSLAFWDGDIRHGQKWPPQRKEIRSGSLIWSTQVLPIISGRKWLLFCFVLVHLYLKCEAVSEKVFMVSVCSKFILSLPKMTFYFSWLWTACEIQPLETSFEKDSLKPLQLPSRCFPLL